MRAKCESQGQTCIVFLGFNRSFESCLVVPEGERNYHEYQAERLCLSMAVEIGRADRELGPVMEPIERTNCLDVRCSPSFFWAQFGYFCEMLWPNRIL